MLSFQPLSLGAKALFDRCFEQGKGADPGSSFTTLFMWRGPHRIQWAKDAGFLHLLSAIDGVTFARPPVGSYYQGLTRPLETLMGFFQQQNLPFLMRDITPSAKDAMERALPGRFIFQEERDAFDYVYRIQDLIQLRGRRYSNKRNHIHHFEKQYPGYRYSPLSSGLVEPCLRHLEDWYQKKERKEAVSTARERDAIAEALENFSRLNYTGGVIRLGTRVAAFTLGERINDDTLLIHGEKADPQIRGLYTVINRDYLKNHWGHLTCVNREDDAGLTGLRSAKLSYCPFKLIAKYSAVLSE